VEGGSYAEVMTRTIAELRAASDEELITEHDREAANAYGGTAYYVDELNRRAQTRVIAAADRLARAGFWLALTNTALAMAAVVIALVK